jgi:integrase/recombinase XerD
MIITFKEYLKRLGHPKATIRNYMNIVDNFLRHYPKAETFRHVDVLGYLEGLNKTGIAPATKSTKLSGVKKYYDYLIDQGVRETHPCRRLFIRGSQKQEKILDDLFTTSELESLMDYEGGRKKLISKNHILISLLIYQGLSLREIVGLKLHHIDMDAGTIFIKGGRMLTARKLEMHPRQFPLFDKYMNFERPKLLINGDSDYFLINNRGNNDVPVNIFWHINMLKCRFPDRNLNCVTIRESVIANFLNERKLPLEQVQLFAGHRYIVTTQKYLQSTIEDQREMLRMNHPLG